MFKGLLKEYLWNLKLSEDVVLKLWYYGIIISRRWLVKGNNKSLLFNTNSYKYAYLYLYLTEVQSALIKDDTANIKVLNFKFGSVQECT